MDIAATCISLQRAGKNSSLKMKKALFCLVILNPNYLPARMFF